MPKGIIISNISNLYYIESEGTIYEGVARGKIKQTHEVPVVGDFVEIEILEEETTNFSNLESLVMKDQTISNKKVVIINILDRITYIKRPKLANLTQIIFVVSLKMPAPDLLLLDKQLAYAELSGLKPIICINKIDLDSQENKDKIMELYTSIGYEVIQTNAKEGDGVDLLKEKLKNNITAFSGNSGVGKSTLINKIFEKELTLEGNISEKIKRGKNTTTSVTLYKISKDEYIADTPGFSTFDLTELTTENLDKYYIEYQPYINNCKYVGCSHVKEDNCGVKDALKNNKISEQRYERYCKIYNELKEKEARKWQ